MGDTKRNMVRAVGTVLALALLAFGTQACGSSGPDSGPRAGNDNPLTMRGIGGSVERGARMGDVIARWGEPDSRKQVPPCRFHNDPVALRALTWDMDEGEVTVFFIADRRQMDSYRVTSPELETRRGVRVGDSLAALKKKETGDLDTWSMLDEDDEGRLWYRGFPNRAAFMYEIEDGKVAAIGGGFQIPCLRSW